MRAVSVWNPWAWALCASLPNGKPFKRGENRTSPLGVKNIGEWILIHTGLKRPDPTTCDDLRDMAEAFGVSMPAWATARRREIGCIVGAVKFTADVPAASVTDPYDALWVTPPPETGPDRRRFWIVGQSVLFGVHPRCKGSVRPLLFKVPDDVEADAMVELNVALGGAP